MTKPASTEFLEFGRLIIGQASVRAGVGPLAPHHVVTREQARLITEELQRMSAAALPDGDAEAAPGPGAVAEHPGA